MVIESYNSYWPKRFEIIKKVLAEHLSSYVAIEHIGSTAIPGMSAKPIIDIDIAVRDQNQFEITKRELEIIGYEHLGDKGIKGREAFGRNENQIAKVLDEYQHHLYVCQTNSREYLRHIWFRNYLRSHPEAVSAYNNLKESIIKKVGENNRAGYVSMKEEECKDFFEDILKKAEEENNH